MESSSGGLLGHLARMRGARVLFPTTLESLDAIMDGLVPENEDIVLAVGGCGDQAFALLEKAGKVVVADVNQAQLDLILKRKQALEAKDYEKFFCGTGTDAEFLGMQYRMEYFDRDRIKLVRERLSNLEIGPAKGIEEHARGADFTKVYASDAISARYNDMPIPESMAVIASGLRKNGLLYVANGHELNRKLRDDSKIGLKLQTELTRKAQAKERIYRPNVYIKI